jgi:hypothetical protein
MKSAGYRDRRIKRVAGDMYSVMYSVHDIEEVYEVLKLAYTSFEARCPCGVSEMVILIDRLEGELRGLFLCMFFRRRWVRNGSRKKWKIR